MLVEEGIVAGGGTALVNIYNKVDEIEAEGDVATGVNIVLKALSVLYVKSLKMLG